MKILCSDPVPGYAQVLEERASAVGTPTVKYVYGLDLVSQTRNIGTVAAPVWQTRYFGYDGLGSVRYLTDGNATVSGGGANPNYGSITDTYDYDAFGILIGQRVLNGTVLEPVTTANRTLCTANSYRYTGEQLDEDLGMYYLRARYYKPELGRFWTIDTFQGRQADPLSLHRYLYCGANAPNGCDPSGNETLVEVMASTFIRTVLYSIAVPAIANYSVEKAGWYLLPASIKQGLKTATSLDAFMAGISGSLPLGKYPIFGAGGAEVLFSPKTGKYALYAYVGLGAGGGGGNPSGALYGGFVFNAKTSEAYEGPFLTLSLPTTRVPAWARKKIDYFFESGFGAFFQDSEVLQEAKNIGIELKSVYDKTTINFFFGTGLFAKAWGFSFGVPVGPPQPGKNASSSRTFSLTEYGQLLPWPEYVPFR